MGEALLEVDETPIKQGFRPLSTSSGKVWVNDVLSAEFAAATVPVKF